MTDSCAALLKESNHGLPGLGQEDREEGLIFSKQQDILEAFEIRFQRVPEGLREEIEAISDSNKLSGLLRAAITSAELESFAGEL